MIILRIACLEDRSHVHSYQICYLYRTRIDFDLVVGSRTRPLRRRVVVSRIGLATRVGMAMASPTKAVRSCGETILNSHVQGGVGGMDASSVLAVGATAALVSTLLGGQTQTLVVGAKPLPPGIQKNLTRG